MFYTKCDLNVQSFAGSYYTIQEKIFYTYSGEVAYMFGIKVSFRRINLNVYLVQWLQCLMTPALGPLKAVLTDSSHVKQPEYLDVSC